MHYPKNYHRSDDSIKDDVYEAITKSPNVDATDIEVSVDHGYVTLKGLVSERKQKKAAEACIEDISGVKDILNYIKLRKDRGLIGEMSIKANMV